MKKLMSKFVLVCCLSGLMALSSAVTAATLTHTAAGVFSSANGTDYYGLGTHTLLWTSFGSGTTVSKLAYYSNRVAPLSGLYPEGNDVYAGQFEFTNGNETHSW